MTFLRKAERRHIMNFEYDVFFSYRHRPLDEEITRKSFNAIESYKL